MVVPQRREARGSSRERELADSSKPYEPRSIKESVNTSSKPVTIVKTCQHLGLAGLRRLPAILIAVLFVLMALLARNDADLLDFLSLASSPSLPSSLPLDLQSSSSSGSSSAVGVVSSGGSGVDAAVFIVMGDLASGPAATLAVEALRTRGEWGGPIVILSDQTACLDHLNHNRREVAEGGRSGAGSGGGGRGDKGWGVTLVSVDDLPPPPQELPSPSGNKWLLAVKAVKCRITELINEHSVPGSSSWQRLLYLDVDVWAAQPLHKSFRHHHQQQQAKKVEEGQEEGVVEEGSFLAAVAPLLSSSSSSSSSQPIGDVSGGGGRGLTVNKNQRHASSFSSSSSSTNNPRLLRSLSSSSSLSSSDDTMVAVAPAWVALFADCAAHAIGWCSGCDAWNTGVMVLPTSSSSSSSSTTTHVCLGRWRRALESGEFPTDQEALEAVAIHGRFSEDDGSSASSSSSSSSTITSSSSSSSRRSGSTNNDKVCSGVAVVAHPARHLLFLKDYLALPKHALLTGWPTFVHVTAANRLDTQDSFYKALASFLHNSLALTSPFGDSAANLEPTC